MSIRPYKALFATHDVGYYGAGRSLRTLLTNFATRHADLLIGKRLLRRNDEAEIRGSFGPWVSGLWQYSLPLDRCFEGKPVPSIPLWLRELRWKLNRKRLRTAIAGARFDFVHLNSLLLHPLIDRQSRYLVHVREVFDGSNPEVFESLGKASGVIFIDEATRKPLQGLAVPSVVLNNPFDMRDIDPGKAAALRSRLGADGKTIFSLVGVISENKGTEFVIDAFRHAKRQGAMLLIVGGGEGPYFERCRALADGHPDIVFLGFERDVATVFGASDYVVRGEPYPCVGRTVYEGLYAGCNVLLPGARRDGEKMPDYPSFEENLFFYPPRDREQLSALFLRCPRPATRQTRRASNVEQFLAGFDRFLAEVLQAGRS